MDNIKLALHQLFSIQQKYGALWTQVNPCPFFSACLNGCAESGRDYSAGGACYSPHGIPFTGVAVLVDSLLALKTICFGENPVPLSRLLEVIRNGVMRRRCVAGLLLLRIWATARGKPHGWRLAFSMT